MVGRTLLHYDILARIGAGGMGEVWRARDTRLDRDVAIKILAAAGGDASIRRERFFREARAASSLIHPNIITIHEINSADGLDFMVMEFVPGETLAALLKHGPLTTRRAVEYAIQIAEALRTAHAAGIVHRDLKPGNVMIADSALVKVLDFGIAKRLDDQIADQERTTAAALTVAGTSLGTPAYMSPEQTLGDPVDARSDLFSFGVVLYEMLSGRLPFEGTTALSLVRQIVHEAPAPLRVSAPSAPDALVAIVDRCLAKDPADRFASADAVLEDLRRANAALDTAVDAAEAPTGVMPIQPPPVKLPVQIPLRPARTIRRRWATPSILRWVRDLGSQFKSRFRTAR